MNLAELLRKNGRDYSFNMLEIGARPAGNTQPVSRKVLARYPSSRVHSVEPDAKLCAELNEKSTPAIRYYPVAVGRAVEKRVFYETEAPICSSLYEPNEELVGLFQNMDVARLKRKTTIETVSLDWFAREHKTGPIDFIEIDIQGAELETFRGGAEVLANVLALVCEVEFIPLYKNQPLFGDVDRFLTERGFMFHKFRGFGGRAMKPSVVNNDPAFPVQYMWSDAVYLRDVLALDTLDEDRLLKLAALMEELDSPDVALHVLLHYDRQTCSGLGKQFYELKTGGRVS